MSSFSTKRKPRAVKPFGDDGGEEELEAPLKFGRRPLKHSSLRRSVNVNEDDTPPKEPDESEEPVVIRPALSRASSTKQKKKRPSSRLSFGGDTAILGDEGGDGAFSTPKKASLSVKALENSVLKNRLDDERPRYSKEYLDELASSTPNTPRDISSLKISSDEELELDLEGAVVVHDVPEPTGQTTVLTEPEIRERKERRARLAREQEAGQEQDYMALDGSDEEEKRDSMQSKRLAVADEDDYEEFVDDGGLSLGKKAEKEARRRQRAQMAELIDAAEGEDDASSDDSEAERRAAYEEAQTRAGMDSLHHSQRGSGVGEATKNLVPRMKPLPDLGECLAKMRRLLEGMEKEVAAKKESIASLEREKEEIAQREEEVQTILDQAGKKYQQHQAQPTSEGQAPLARDLTLSPRSSLPPAERGLESFGTTEITEHDGSWHGDHLIP